MTSNPILRYALMSCFGDDYEGIAKHLSLPELLMAAAAECFLNKQSEEVESAIREALIYFRKHRTIEGYETPS